MQWQLPLGYPIKTAMPLLRFTVAPSRWYIWKFHVLPMKIPGNPAHGCEGFVGSGRGITTLPAPPAPVLKTELRQIP